MGRSLCGPRCQAEAPEVEAEMLDQRRQLPEPAASAAHRVLVTGATGLLGRQVVALFQRRKWTVRGLGLTRAAGDIVACDLLNQAELVETFWQFRPTVVVHCAAERRPDRLEGHEVEAMQINAELAGRIAELCQQCGAWMICLSTNYVFDGSQPPYAEHAATHPLNTYGQSKLAGEVLVRKAHPRAAVLRVPLLYGPIEYAGETSVTALLDTIKQQAPKLDNWQERFPTSCEDVAEVLEAFVSAYGLRGAQEPGKFSGIFHWQANEMHTKYTMAVTLAEILSVDTSHFVNVDGCPPPGSAPRPRFERMSCERLERLLQIEDEKQFRRDFKTGLRAVVLNYLAREVGTRQDGVDA